MDRDFEFVIPERERRIDKATAPKLASVINEFSKATKELIFSKLQGFQR